MIQILFWKKIPMKRRAQTSKYKILKCSNVKQWIHKWMILLNPGETHIDIVTLFPLQNGGFYVDTLSTALRCKTPPTHQPNPPQTPHCYPLWTLLDTTMPLRLQYNFITLNKITTVKQYIKPFTRNITMQVAITISWLNFTFTQKSSCHWTEHRSVICIDLKDTFDFVNFHRTFPL